MSQMPPVRHNGEHTPTTPSEKKISESSLATQYPSHGGRLSYALHTFLNFIWFFPIALITSTASFSDWRIKQKLINNLSNKLSEISKDKNFKAWLQPLKTFQLTELEIHFEKFPKQAPQELAFLENPVDFLNKAKKLHEFLPESSNE